MRLLVTTKLNLPPGLGPPLGSTHAKFMGVGIRTLRPSPPSPVKHSDPLIFTLKRNKHGRQAPAPALGVSSAAARESTRFIFLLRDVVPAGSFLLLRYKFIVYRWPV